MTALPQRRLPGVRFEVPPPALDEALPRMDIALFVGFANRGPLHRAVPLESWPDFVAVYGDRILLARDPATGDVVQGQLHLAVRAFFSQGGRRCWVLRVAGDDVHTAVFPVPALLQAQRDQGAWRLEPATLQAASPGSGADAQRLSVQVDTSLLRLKPSVSADGGPPWVEAPAAAVQDVRVGDLLRVDLDALRLHVRVQAVDVQGAVCRMALGHPVALQAVASGSPLPELQRIERWAGEGLSAPREVAATGQWLDDGRLRAHCRLPSAPWPEAGEVVRLVFDRGVGWMSLDQANLLEAPEPGRAPQFALQGRPWLEAEAEAEVALSAWQAQADERLAHRLRVTLQVREGQALTAAGPLRMTADRLQREGSAWGLDEAAGFALVSPELPGEAMWLPLAEPAGESLGPWASALPALERDGLAEFSWRLFAEPSLAPFASDLLPRQAEALRNAGRTWRPLRGVHAVFGAEPPALVDEPTLLAVPDAVHPGWQPAPPVDAWTELPALPEPPDPCAGEAFKGCDAAPLPAPRFLQGADPDAQGGFTLYWTQVEPGTVYRLEESADPDFSGATLLLEAGVTRFAVLAKPAGSLYYRVRATQGPRRSPWSRPVRIEVGVLGYETLAPDGRELQAVHRLMLRCAAGRGDMLAVLSLPSGHDTAMAARHADALRDATPLHDASLPPALGEDEARALSHGALYHPWLVTRRDDEIQRFTPDGAVCGQLAATALERGAWIAVANRPLRDLLALLPPGMAPTLAQRQQLLDAQVNLLRSAPHGFVASSADTLTPDSVWRPVNVRRLMALLRRLALRRGADYVFEPNDDTLRRTVERSFEAVLDLLFRRGALAGAQAREAYRVDVGDELNTPPRRDLGQFWVELKVAPALPLSFLTVRLAREGDRVVSREVH